MNEINEINENHEEKEKRINETLICLLIGIVVSGILIQLIELGVAAAYPVFAGSKFSFALGLWIGVGVAIGLAVHMYHSIDKALDMPSDDANKYMRKAYMIRTVGILVAAFVVHKLKLGYVMATFLGMLCLKFGAFIAPLFGKLVDKYYK